MKYTLSKNYEISGTFEHYELVRMAKKGELQDGSGWFACEEGQKKWIAISKIPEIKSALDVLAKPKNIPPSGNNFTKGKK